MQFNSAGNTNVLCDFTPGAEVVLQVTPVVDGIFSVLLVSTTASIISFQFDVETQSGQRVAVVVFWVVEGWALVHFLVIACLVLICFLGKSLGCSLAIVTATTRMLYLVADHVKPRALLQRSAVLSNKTAFSSVWMCVIVCLAIVNDLKPCYFVLLESRFPCFMLRPMS